MARLPVVSGKETIRAFEKLGWLVHRRESSHVGMHRHGRSELLTIPNHTEVAKGTLRALIRQANITVKEFIEALRK